LAAKKHVKIDIKTAVQNKRSSLPNKKYQQVKKL